MSADTQARWFRSLFEHARTGIAVVDLDDRIVDANPALATMLGTTTDALVGSLFTDHTAPGDGDNGHALFRAVAAGGSPERSLVARYRRADDSPLWGRTTAWLVRSDGDVPDRVLAMIEDVTAARAAQDQLRAQAELARLGEMAAVVAHEVKNPLTGIGGAVQILRDRLPPDSPDRALLGEIHERLRGLNRIVEDLQLFARPMRPRLGPVSLREILDQAFARLREIAGQAPLQVELEGADVVLLGDRALLERLFLSLLINAAQAMDCEGTIRVALRATAHHCIVEIGDEGAGADENTSRRMFDPFFTTKSKGTGLGLAIARKIAEAHAGTIQPGATPAGGGLFSVALPREPTAQS